MSHLVCACTVKAAKSAPNRIVLDFMTILRSAGILTYFLQHGARQGERRGESRRLDAEQMDQTRDAMLARPLDVEVRCGLPSARGLRPDSRVAGQQRAIGQARPIASDGRIEAVGAARIHFVIDA